MKHIVESCPLISCADDNFLHSVDDAVTWLRDGNDSTCKNNNKGNINYLAEECCI